MLDYRAQIEAAIWSLLQADADFLTQFLAGLRFKQSGGKISVQENVKRAPGDFPQIRIELDDGPQSESPPRVYGSTAYSYLNVDMPIILNQRVELSILFDPGRQKTSQRAPYESIIEKILWRGWPTFGISYVNGADWTLARDEVTIGGREYPRTMFIIDFALMPMLSQLTA